MKLGPHFGSVNLCLFAPEGQRALATGGAKRNPWNDRVNVRPEGATEAFLCPSGAGRKVLGNNLPRVSPVATLRGPIRGRKPRTSLHGFHPWLHSAAPSGAENREPPSTGFTRGYTPRPHPGPKTENLPPRVAPVATLPDPVRGRKLGTRFDRLSFILEDSAHPVGTVERWSFAPKGQRAVATGGAKRNPWNNRRESSPRRGDGARQSPQVIIRLDLQRSSRVGPKK